jgi:hypothetical protein
MKKLLIITILLLTIFNHTYAQKPLELKDAIHIPEVLSRVKEDVSSDPYKLIFSDEFNGNSLNTSVWNYETGYGPYNDGWGNDEWQLYTSNEENVYVENGNLIISARTFGNSGKRDGIFRAAIIVEESFVIISSDKNIQSDVRISDSTIGEWGTRTYINPDANTILISFMTKVKKYCEYSHAE